MENKIISFKRVKEPYGWLGNMAPYPIKYNNLEFKTTEALFQYLRFENNPEIQEEIRKSPSPMSAKMIAKDNYHLVPPNIMYQQKDIDNMLLCLTLKLEQHPNLQKELLETGDAFIIEDCTSRPQGSGLFWGAALENGSWKGKNVLGKLWKMKRDELKKNLNKKIHI
jgi:ribA/ribD-fused uncharacterized protein